MMHGRIPFRSGTTNVILVREEEHSGRTASGFTRGRSSTAFLENSRGRTSSPRRFIQNRASCSSRPSFGQGNSSHYEARQNNPASYSSRSSSGQSNVSQHETGQNRGSFNSRPSFGQGNASQYEARQTKTHPGGQRMYPIGVKVMQNLLEKEPYMIPIELLKNNSGYEILLNDIDLREFKVGLIVQLLEKSISSRANDEGVIDLLLVTFRNSNFRQKLMTFISEIKFEYKDAKYLGLIGSIISEFLRLSPANAYPLISNLVDVCIGVIIHLRSEDPVLVSGLEQAFENIQVQIKESRIKFRAHKAGLAKNIAPPDNFRELEVIPTCAELNTFNRPFLRGNVINGRYENSDHYLDVQFRLMKEDFVRPLREGLQDYRKTNHKRNADVRIYTDVTLDSSAVDKSEYVHYLKLSLGKNFKIENSRRLMYGNIICISYDNFETMITATIANRDKLKDHLIAVKIETEPFKLERLRKYTLIESRAYFISYKHTLLALQRIVEVPLKEYLVNVNESKSSPDYLQRFSSYEIKIGVNLVSNVTLLDPIEYWPSSKELHMDETQRRALHGALTRQLAIIQGPPGTGKTYLGLQITKILLHNKNVWNPGKRNPILVVCYTNHALDQFLEGMLPFTTDLIRVGSQSKNEALAVYQINKRINSFRGAENDLIWRRYCELRDEIRKLQLIMESIAQNMKKINSPGIIDFLSFSKEFPSIIPARFQEHIKRYTMKGFLTQYITDSQDDDNAEPMYMPQNVSNVIVDCDTGEEFYDVDEDILQEEEQSRIIEDSDQDDGTASEEDLRTVQVPYFGFDITPSEILKKVEECKIQINEDPFNKKSRIYAENMQILGLVNRAIEAGQKVKFTEEECKLLERYANMDKINFIQRWKLYNYWKGELSKKYGERLSQFEKMHMKLDKSMISVKDLRYLNFMKTVDIVGMTTTGAAQYCKILHDLAPSIVIVEEAAEIMESHLVTSLSSKCQHLIIIGDHQQLRPKPNVYDLAQKYHLDTSFFERMINNGIIYETLEFQHRMKPMISDLLVPTIYEDLKDHPSVFKYPKIKGIQKDLFFLDHNVFEDFPLDEAESFENTYEAEFLMGLCRHLLYQGYQSEDITIITPYLGQHRCLKQLQRRGEFYACLNIRISVLDNYQGEESNIILLSLVRSNEEGKVGFVKIENRVCVALSRAKHAMYIIGNMSQMAESSDLWRKIKKKLVDGENIGPELLLECQNHPDQVMKVNSLNDMLLKSPEGGCKLPCSAFLPRCQHKCPRLCHIADQDHTRVNCTRPCPKTICNLGHACPKLCFQECAKCVVLIKKLLPCGHEHLVKCSVKPEDFDCPTVVKKELPYCKHIEDIECHIDVNKYKCPRNCMVRLDCGHQCKNRCHALKDPNHESYDCHVPCDKMPLNCEFNHKCRKKCFETCGPCNEIITRHMKCGHTLHQVKCGTLEKDIKCPQKCNKMLSCGHKCSKTCGEDCGGCMESVDKIVPECGHRIKFSCSKIPALKDCGGKCIKLLACQHRCTNMCKESCTSRCLYLVDTNHKCPKGHKVKLPCHLARNSGTAFSVHNTNLQGKTVGDYCTEQCGTALDCGHFCKSKCGTCLNGRLHATCQEKCDKVLVCGHVCKEPCSTDCPPCQSRCLWKCSHSRCTKVCGVPCVNCQEQCNRQCPHVICKSKCGDICTIDPCSHPCLKKLGKCGHKCIGYCGEPCPEQCRICDKDEVTEIFFGTEDEADARFVLLEDCGHIFEGESLDGWMKVSEDGKIEINMKSCPKCKTPIYSTQRYQNHILDAYNNVRKVKRKHFTSKKTVDRNHLKRTLHELVSIWVDEISTLRENLGFDVNFQPKRKQRPISDQQMLLYEFQLRFLLSAKKTLENVCGRTTKLRELINSLMKYTLNISQQTMNEFSCELRRLDICVSIEKLRERVKPAGITDYFYSGSSSLNTIVAKIDSIMDPTIKFDKESEQKVIQYLKEAEKLTGSLGITNQERMEILKAMGLAQGHWYACPNGHVYCITECGGATVESVCPECKARIGGSQHTLRSDNRVATEMDGATRSAYPGGPQF